MTPLIRTTVAHGPSIDRDVLEALCSEQPGISLTEVVEAGPQGLLGEGGIRDDALVVACNGSSEGTLDFIRAAVAQRPDRPVVVLFEGTANGFTRAAIEAGAEDLVHGGALALDGDAGTQVAFALEKAIARRAGAALPGSVHGQITTVLGPKGGTGKTLTACNLAVGLAAAGRRVVLVDLDLQFGDVGLALGLHPERTLYELATSGGSLDAEKLEDYLAQHTSGLKVLMAPRRPDQASAVTVDFLRDLFDALAGMAEHIVIDTPPSFSPEVIAAIDRSENLCVVAMLDALSLKNTRLALETLERMRVSPESIRVVLNRADSKVGVTADDAALLLGRTPDVLVPSHREITRSVNEATPIVACAAGSEGAKAFRALADAIAPAPPVRIDGNSDGGVRRALRRRGKAA